MTLAKEARVSAITLVLLALAVGLTAYVAHHPAVFVVGARWWHFVIAFAVAEWAVAHVEIRRQTHTISFSETVLVVGLLLVDPVGMVLGRVAGAIVALGLRRQEFRKFSFNTALFGSEAALAAFLFHGVFQQHSDGPLVWALAGLSVLASVVSGSVVVASVIAMYEEGQSEGLIAAAVRSQLISAVASISLAVVGTAAVLRTWTNIFYLLILVAGGYVVLREQIASAQRASSLEAINRFTSTLAGLQGFTSVMTTTLEEAVHLLRSTQAMVVVPTGFSLPPGAYKAIDGMLTITDDCPVSVSDLSDVEQPQPLADVVDGDGSRLAPEDGFVAPLDLAGCRLFVLVWNRATEVASYPRAELPMFAALIAQTRIAGQRALLVDRLEHEANHDSLTGLPNRLGFARAFHDDFPGVGGSLLVIDLDRFKEVNDTLGHPTGDRALEIIAERLANLLDEGTILARLGGDEFVVFDPAASGAEAASELAGRLTAAIEKPVQVQELSLQIGASIGIAFRPDHGNDLTTLMSHADIAMYVAKADNTGWQFYSPQDDTNSPRRLDLIAGLRRATELNEIDVWYQPKMRLSDGRITGAEALARWNHPRYSFVPPDEFIAIAEQGGLMRDLTDAVIERAARDATRWNQEGKPLQVAINLSMRNLLDSTLPDRLAETLTLHGLQPDLISFEVTETSIMSDRDRVAETLDQLRDLGFELAIDDFGTGYSSLAYLRNLPVDELKIDRAFVTDLDIDSHNEVIVRSTIELGHNLGLRVVAEGVERDRELGILHQLGCDYAQGYLISRPLPPDRFDAWLEQQRVEANANRVGNLRSPR